MTASASALAAAQRALPALLSNRPDPVGWAEEEQLAARVVWSHLVEPGDAVASRLIAELSPLGALQALEARDQLSTQDVAATDFAEGRRRWLPRLSAASIETSLDVADRVQARLLVPGDAEWPQQVDDLGPHAPLALWVRGQPGILARLQPSVAMVGARAATSYGEHVAMEVAADLAGSGIPIVSGAAYGIDGAAHRASLAAGGTTVALLAGGVDRPYPAGHADLIERILASGAVVSEVPCGSAPTKWRFLQRNRIIAALAEVTVVVEAGWRSGSLNTASHALAIGRTVAAVPGPVTSAASAGAHRLLREGAICVTNADDVRELLRETDILEHLDHRGGDVGGRDARGRHERGRDDRGRDERGDERPPTDDRSRVRDALSTRVWRDPDELARRSGMAATDVESVLGLLALSGEVESGFLGWRRAPSR
jgi:DNA processing protein